jgi:quinol-cytochrome oxidoreductase complex cytochrome b subunit
MHPGETRSESHAAGGQKIKKTKMLPWGIVIDIVIVIMMMMII